MPFAQFIGTGNGSTKQFTIPFPYVKKDHIVVALDFAAITGFSFINDNTIEFDTISSATSTQETSGAPKNGVRIDISRDTPLVSALVDFVNGSTLTAGDLDTAVLQLLYGIQEAKDEAALGLQFTQQGQDAKNLRIINVSDPLNAQDAVTKNYLERSGSISSTQILDGTIQTGDIGADQITGALIPDDAINSEHYAAGSIDLEHMSANSVDSAQLVNGSVDLIHMSANSVDSDQYVDGSIDLIHMSANSVDSDQYVDGSIDRVHLEADIIDSTKLADNAVNSEHYVDGSIDREHLSADIVDSTKLADDAVGTEHIQDGAVKVDQINNAEITLAKLNPSAVITAAELATATSNDTSLFTSAAADAAFLRQDSSETIASGDTWSGLDSKVATTAAIDLRVIELVDNVGGFVPIANETSFPTENPDINTSGSAKGGTIVSVQAASTALTAQSGTTLTIANGRGTGNAVIITGVSVTIPQGFGFLVETTATDHTYAFHRLVPKATEVSTVAANAVAISQAGNNVTDINNFADLYQISTSAPTARYDSSSLQVGDLWFDSSSNKVLMIYDGSSGDGFTAATPNASDLININIVAGQLVYQEDLGLITEAVNTGSGNNSVNTVATDIAKVNTVAGIATDVTAVANDATDIGTVAAKATEIGRLGTAAAVADMAILGTTDVVADMALLATTDVVADMNTLATADVVADMNTLATTSVVNNLNTVAGIASDVTAVANDATDIGAVAGKATEIGRLGTADAVADLAILGTTDVVADMNLLATSDVIADMALLAVTDVIADMALLATTAVIADMALLATTDVIADMAILATNDVVADMNTLATSDIVSDMNTLATSANVTAMSTCATNISDVNTFANRYRIASSAPTTSLDVGDLYFDTTLDELRVYNGSSWQGGVTASGSLAGLTANTFSGNQTINANIIVSGTVDGRDVATDGTKLDGIESNATADQTASEIVSLISGQTIAPDVITTTNLTLDFGSIA